MRKLFRTIISIIIVSIIIGFIGLLQLGNNVVKSSNNINSEQASIEKYGNKGKFNDEKSIYSRERNQGYNARPINMYHLINIRWYFYTKF